MDGLQDFPGAAFELVTANLEWEFSAGAAEHDAVDAAVVALARDSGMFQAVFRTWTRDPVAGWVRVLIGYATQAADPARAALVAAAQAAGAARTCVEVVAPAGLGDVHRWLERRCVPLWRAEPLPRPAPGDSPRPPAAPSPDLDPDAPRPTRSAAAGKGPEIDLDLGQRVERAGVEDELLDGGLTLVGLTQAEPVAELPADERDGRDESDRALVEWAAAHPNLLGLTRGAVTVRGNPIRVYLLAVDPEADRPAVRRGAGAVLRGRGLSRCGVELFCPLEPIPRFYLELFTKGTQLWRSNRKLGRPAPPPPTGTPPAAGG